MVSTILEAVQLLDRLFFVTSKAAIRQFSGDLGDPQFQQKLERSLGDRLHTIPDNAENIFDAVEGLPEKLRRQRRSIDGVVILGSYATVPSRRIHGIDPALLQELELSLANIVTDLDDWWVWNDDPYGDWIGNLLPDLPVSRLPIIPKAVNSPFVKPARPLATGVRGDEFPFADTIYSLLGPKADVKLSGPYATNPKSGGGQQLRVLPDDLEMDRLYLVLHGQPGGDLNLKGTLSGTWNPVAIDHSVVNGQVGSRPWQSSGVVFAAICWGALTIEQIAMSIDPGDAITPLQIDRSYPLQFIDRGANAFVGFTALHHVPVWPTVDLVLGAPLHQLFWEKVTLENLVPAEALFQAKKQFIEGLQANGRHPLAQAEELKAYWAATCIGIGW